jgi:hypothetical protein
VGTKSKEIHNAIGEIKIIIVDKIGIPIHLMIIEISRIPPAHIQYFLSARFSNSFLLYELKYPPVIKKNSDVVLLKI